MSTLGPTLALTRGIDLAIAAERTRAPLHGVDVAPGLLRVADGVEPQTVVAFPGTGNRAGRMEQLARQLQTAGHRVFVLDQPDVETERMATTAARGSALMDAAAAVTGRAQVHTVGFSRGGNVEQLIVLDHDGVARTTSMTSIGAPLRGVHLLGTGAALGGSKLLAGAGTRSVASETVRSPIGSMFAKAVGRSMEWMGEHEAGGSIAVLADMSHTGANMRRIVSDLPEAWADVWATGRADDWRFTSIAARLPGMQTDSVVPTWSTDITEQMPLILRHHLLEGAAYTHKALPDNPDVARLVSHTVAGRPID